MILTGKCLEDFRKYMSYNHGLDLNDWEVQKQVFLNALIIDFFDSVEIYIQNWAFVDFVEGQDTGFDCSVIYDKINHDSDIFFDTRSQAISAAIIKANEIYNSKEK